MKRQQCPHGFCDLPGPMDGVQVDDSTPVVAAGEDVSAYAQRVQVLFVELSSLLPQYGPLAHSSFAVENHGARHAFSGVGLDLGPSSVVRALLPP